MKTATVAIFDGLSWSRSSLVCQRVYICVRGVQKLTFDHACKRYGFNMIMRQVRLSVARGNRSPQAARQTLKV